MKVTTPTPPSREEILQGIATGATLAAQGMVSVMAAIGRCATALEALAEALEQRTENPPTGPTVPQGPNGGIDMPVGPDYPSNGHPYDSPIPSPYPSGTNSR